MEQIKIIEQEIRNILEQGKDFIEIVETFDTVLDRISQNHSSLEEKKLELLNILLKYPKRKVLFEFDFKRTSYDNQHIVVGVNENGLGLQINSQNNLRNLNDYWAKNKFEELIKDKDFRILFLKKVSKKINHKLLKVLLEKYEKYDDKVINLKKGEIGIEIINNSLTLKHYSESGYYTEVLKIIKNKEFKKREPNDFLTEITETDLDFEFERLIKFAYLLKYQDEIKGILNKKIVFFEKLDKELQAKVDYIEGELKPYKALKNL